MESNFCFFYSSVLWLEKNTTKSHCYTLFIMESYPYPSGQVLDTFLEAMQLFSVSSTYSFTFSCTPITFWLH